MRSKTTRGRQGDTLTVNGGEFVDGFAVSIDVRCADGIGPALLTPAEALKFADDVRFAALQVKRAKCGVQ